MRNLIQYLSKSKPIVEHQSRSGKKGRKLSGIFQSRVNSMGNLSLAINFSHCCSKDWVKAQKAISFYLFNLFPFFWHALIPLIQQFFLRFFLNMQYHGLRTPNCPIHVVTFTLISNLATDYIQKRRGQDNLFSFEYNLLPNLISK